MNAPLKPTSDLFVRYLLGSQHNADLLLDFINAVLAIRSLYYWAKNFSGQLKTGADYPTLRPVICINLLDFLLFETTPKLHTVFSADERQRVEFRLTDHFEIHFLELPKFAEQRSSLQNHLRGWLLFFSNTEEDMKTVFEDFPAVQRAQEEFERFKADQALMAAHISHEMWLHDQATRLKQATDEGLNKGRAEGLTQGREEARVETARSMLKKDYSINEIAEITGLSAEQVAALRPE